MLFRNPRVLPVLLFCIGLGLAGVRGWELRQLPMVSPEDIEASVELNYMLDLARGRARATDPIPELPEAEAQRRKAAIRAEVLANTQGKRQQLETEVRQGVMLVLVGALLYFAVLVMQRRKILPAS